MTNKEKLAEMLMQEIFGSAIIRTADDVKYIWEKLIKVVDHLIANGVVRPKSEWILNRNGSATCKRCRKITLDAWDFDHSFNFCPHCGADMREAIK